MRTIFTITLTLWAILDCSSQTDVTKSFGDKYDFSTLLATNKDYGIDGVFDEMYQRIQFAFIKITKSTENNLTYEIIGADRLKGNVTQFTGEIKITKIVKNEGNLYYPTKPSDDKLIQFKAMYEFKENKESKGAGIFKGTLSFYLTLDKGAFIDNLEEYEGDGFSNFIYRGTWTSYLTGKTKKCIFGEGGLPDTGDFNQGDGSLVVNDKYKKNGWEMDKMNLKLLDNPKQWWTK